MWQLACGSRRLTSTAAPRRTYNYVVDLQGRLFLEETQPKNVATSLKSAPFLRFFWHRLRVNDGSLGDACPDRYPFVSPCGGEVNFVAVEDQPVVFEDVVVDTDATTANGATVSVHDVLTFAGGTMKFPFDPAALRVADPLDDARAGRLYHPVATKHLPLRYGLLRSHLALQLANTLEVGGDGGFSFMWRGVRHPIPAVHDVNAPIRVED